MAGSFAGFDPAAFKDAIHFAMTMGAPPDVNEQATFYFPAVKTYNKGVDADDTPFDPTATTTVTQPQPVKVPCAVEFKNAAGETVDFGILETAYVSITLLDDDYNLVKGCEYVVIRGEKYIYRNTEAPMGLFSVGVYVMNFFAASAT